MELKNEISLENLIIRRKVSKEYWLVPGKVYIRLSSITLKDNLDLKLDTTVFADRMDIAHKLLAASLEDFVIIDQPTKFPTTIEERIDFLKTLPTHMVLKMLELLNKFDNDVMELFKGEDSKKN